MVLSLLGGRAFKNMSFNVANLALLKWVTLPVEQKSEDLLATIIHWGDRSGALWENHKFRERVIVLWEHFQTKEWQNREEAKEIYQQGMLLEEQGKASAALTAYRQAFKLQDRWIEAGYAVYHLAEASMQQELARHQMEVLYRLSPEYPMNDKAVFDDGKRLLGYDLDEWHLEWGGEAIPIVFYWELPDAIPGVQYNEADEWRYIRIRERLYQVGTVRNLLPNGGFERDLSSLAALPYGYKNTASAVKHDVDYKRSHYILSVDKRDKKLTQTVALLNSTGESNGMTTIFPIEVEVNQVYLFGGWIQVKENALGYLGGVWRTMDNENIRYQYLTRELSDTSWAYFSSTFVAPDGAEIMIPLLINKGEDRVCFDDLILFLVDPPEYH
jgi:hypothetical protein